MTKKKKKNGIPKRRRPYPESSIHWIRASLIQIVLDSELKRKNKTFTRIAKTYYVFITSIAFVWIKPYWYIRGYIRIRLNEPLKKNSKIISFHFLRNIRNLSRTVPNTMFWILPPPTTNGNTYSEYFWTSTVSPSPFECYFWTTSSSTGGGREGNGKKKIAKAINFGSLHGPGNNASIISICNIYEYRVIVYPDGLPISGGVQAAAVNSSRRADVFAPRKAGRPARVIRKTVPPCLPPREGVSRRRRTFNSSFWGETHSKKKKKNRRNSPASPHPPIQYFWLTCFFIHRNKFKIENATI